MSDGLKTKIKLNPAAWTAIDEGMAYSGTVYRSTYSERGRMDGDISGPAAYGSVLAYMFVPLDFKCSIQGSLQKTEIIVR